MSFIVARVKNTAVEIIKRKLRQFLVFTQGNSTLICSQPTLTNYYGLKVFIVS
jgi:hypothetical protein